MYIEVYGPMYIRMKSHWFRKGCERVFEIMCTMYDLKEASMQFYKLLSGWLTEQKWIIGKSDRCLFTRGLLIVGLSTDDGLIVNKERGTVELDQFILEFKGRFECTVDIPCKKYLGVEITTHENGAISLTMKLKIEKLKELIYPELDLHIFPIKPVYDPMLPGWSEDLSDQSP